MLVVLWVFFTILYYNTTENLYSFSFLLQCQPAVERKSLWIETERMRRNYFYATVEKWTFEALV